MEQEKIKVTSDEIKEFTIALLTGANYKNVQGQTPQDVIKLALDYTVMTKQMADLFNNPPQANDNPPTPEPESAKS